MKVYKEKQFLVFEFEDGKTVKYDFATKTCIGKKGQPVVDLRSQLTGYTIQQLCEDCVDKQYGKFLRYVQKHGDFNYRGIHNIGTILDRVPYFSNLEQFFAAGIEDIVDYKFNYSINNVPKGLLKLCRSKHITLSNDLVDYYKRSPDAYLYACTMDYESLNTQDVFNILTTKISVCHDGEHIWSRMYTSEPFALYLIENYGYTIKGLMKYMDYLKTYEAIEDMGFMMREIYDYVAMMSKISNKFDKYPRHFLTTHKIAVRNYNRLKQEFDDAIFRSRINKDMEKTFGEYCFIYPSCAQDIKDEAVSQNNCVASYIKRVLDGQCDILFLRRKSSPDTSLVTIEVRNGKIVQARRRFNYPVSDEEQEVIDKWNKYYANKMKEKESEELKNVG